MILSFSRFAYDHNCLMLKDSCLHYIWENFVAISQEEEFGDLPKEMICSDDLLGSENLKVDSEYQVIICYILWKLNFELQKINNYFSVFAKFNVVHPLQL